MQSIVFDRNKAMHARLHLACRRVRASALCRYAASAGYIIRQRGTSEASALYLLLSRRLPTRSQSALCFLFTMVVLAVIVETLTTVRSILAELHKLQNILKERKDSVLQYEKTIGRLQKELEEVQGLFSATFDVGNQVLLQRMLEHPTGRHANDGLVEAIKNARATLINKQGEVETLVKKVQSETFTKAVLIRVLDKQGEFQTKIDTAIADVDNHRLEIRHLCQHFHYCYVVFNSNKLDEHTMKALRSALEVVQGAFDQNPFHTTASSLSSASSIEPMLFYAEQLESTMATFGRHWVEDRQDGGYVELDSLERTQVELMQNFSNTLQARAPGEKSSPLLNVKGSESILSLIHSAGQRVKRDHFSIAFCGMVKAG